jgi:hypothetical protein
MKNIEGLIFAVGIAGFSCHADDKGQENGREIFNVQMDSAKPQITFLSWDTEGSQQNKINLLRPAGSVHLECFGDKQDIESRKAKVQIDAVEPAALDCTVIRSTQSPELLVYDLWLDKNDTLPGEGKDGTGRTGLKWEIRSVPSELKFSFTLQGWHHDKLAKAELVFPFDLKVTATTVISSRWADEDRFRLPAIINAPNRGPILVTGNSPQFFGRLVGKGKEQADLYLEIPVDSEAGRKTSGSPLELIFTPIQIPHPVDVKGEAMWLQARRGWINAFGVTSRWGDPKNPMSAPPGLLANNVVSDPASVSIWMYADQAFFTPELAPNVSVLALVRRTVDFWLDRRMRRTGEVIGYWNYLRFLDANAGPLIAAWDYVESTDDLRWLRERIDQLEFVADYLARRDVDGDGMVEAIQSGNAGTLRMPARSCSWFDCFGGGKDGYANALIYRAWRCLADLEHKLERTEQQKRYSGLADKLKAAYVKTLYNPETGWLGWWRSEDGKLHDYASPAVNGLAIEYGLVEPAQGKQILSNMRALMAKKGFQRFDLGVPCTLLPVRKEDYIASGPGNGLGEPAQEDGTDSFEHYMNGGITAAQTRQFIAAHYVVGENEKADEMLNSMLGHLVKTGFQSRVGGGIDWNTWDGKACGYEGYLADCFTFLQGIMLREKSLRDKLYRPLRN